MAGASLRVAVVGGGRNCEHDVSLASARSVRAVLGAAGHRASELTITRDGGWTSGGTDVGLAAAVRLLQAADVVFPAVHGPLGEDGALAALCELAAVPYVGSGIAAGALAMDKWATKCVAEQAGVRVAPARLLTDPRQELPAWSGPVVVKPVAAGSSHGVALVREAAGLAGAVAAAFALDGRVLVEDVVSGREVDVAVLGRPDGTRRVGPPLEVVGDGLFDTATKYDGTAVFDVPAAVSDGERELLAAGALAVYDLLGCAGVARVDFFLTAQGLVLNEVNTMPGMTEHSQVPMVFAADGLPYPELLDILVRDAVSEGAR